MSLDFVVWKDRLFTSISNLSRTSTGASNTAYTGKPPLLITDPALLRRQAAQNLRLAISHVWIRGPYVEAEPVKVRAFIETLSARISEGLLPADRRGRTWELDKSKYPESLPPAAVPQAYSVFCDNVASILASGDVVDSVHNAAWVERMYDGHLHPLADGCGRVAKLLGAWILLRDGKYPGHLEDRRAYYAAMESSWQVWNDFYRAHVLS